MDPNNTFPQIPQNPQQPTEQPNINNSPQDPYEQPVTVANSFSGSSQNPYGQPVTPAAPVSPQQPMPQQSQSQPLQLQPQQQPQLPTMPWDRPKPYPQGDFSSQSAPANVFGVNQQLIGQSTGKKKKIITAVVGVFAGLLLLSGGIAAAYFGMIVPNKPENVLKQAIKNTLQEEQFIVKGALETKPMDASKENAPLALKTNFESKANKKSGEIKVNLTISGVDLPLEARYVDNNIYLKAGDLSTLSSLVNGYAQMFGIDPAQADASIKRVSDLVSNQWIVIDSTLLDQSGISCVLDVDFAFTEQDIRLLEELFTKHQFAKIDSTSKDTVNGKSAIKYEIRIDNKEWAKFLEDKQLEDLSVIKALSQCPDEDSEDFDVKDLTGESIMPLTLWVDKGTKRITKIAGKSTDQEAKRLNFTDTFEMVIGYENVTVSKPANAKPAMQLFGELQQEFVQLLSSLPSDLSMDENGDDFIMEEEFDFGDDAQFDEYFTQ